MDASIHHSYDPYIASNYTSLHHHNCKMCCCQLHVHVLYSIQFTRSEVTDWVHSGEHSTEHNQGEWGGRVQHHCTTLPRGTANINLLTHLPHTYIHHNYMALCAFTCACAINALRMRIFKTMSVFPVGRDARFTWPNTNRVLRVCQRFLKGLRRDGCQLGVP